ncbi:MAG: peptidase S15, partial [Baekduiaceae bacterium]
MLGHRGLGRRAQQGPGAAQGQRRARREGAGDLAGARGSTNRYQNWEVVDPEKWVPYGYACVRVDSRGCGASPGYIDHFS